MRSPLVWYGGKGLLTHRLLPLVPEHWTYVEPFAGGASLLFAKPPSPVEVLNDIHEELVNFYSVLKDERLFAQFERLAHLTPYARQEWERCRDLLVKGSGRLSRVQRALAFFVVLRQGRPGDVLSGHRGGGWSRCVQQSDSGVSSSVARWLRAVDGLPEVFGRLRGVQIDRMDWRECLVRYDTPETLFYCDPPYLLATRASNRRRYRHEFTADDHTDLVAAVQRLRGRVLLSGYRHDLYAPLVAAGWHTMDFQTVTNATSGQREARTETVWANYPLTPQRSLFEVPASGGPA